MYENDGTDWGSMGNAQRAVSTELSTMGLDGKLKRVTKMDNERQAGR